VGRVYPEGIEPYRYKESFIMGTIPITLAFTKTDDSKPALIAATDGYDREFYEGTLKDHKGDPVREFVIDVDMDAEPASEPTPNLLLRFRVQGGTLSLTGAYFVDIWTIEAIESVGPFSDEQVVTRRLALDVDTVAAAFGPVPLESVVVA
jgi:hypothetical protein